MDCVEVASRLVAYHFATLDEGERDAVEAHILECRACLSSYFALKRARDGIRSSSKPSAHARMRLREAVALEFAAAKASRVEAPAGALASLSAFLARPIPVYQGALAAALAAALIIVLPRLVGGGPTASVGDGSPDIDSARPRASSLEIY